MPTTPLAPSKGRLQVWRNPGAKTTLLLFVLPLLLQGIALVFLVWNEPKRREAELRALLAERAIVDAESASRLLIQRKDRITVAVLTGSSSLVAQGDGEPVAELTDLRQRESGGDPRRAALAVDLLTVAKAMVSWISGVEELGKAGRTEEVARLVGVEGERLQQALLVSLARFEAEERRVGQEGSERLAAVRLLRRTVLLGGGTASLMITLLGAGLFYRQISSRLAVVAANARRIAENAPLAPTAAGSDSDEITPLDLTIRQTALRLTETIREREATLEETAVELAEANRELRAKTEELEAFIRGVSHDLRSPLTDIKGFNRKIGLSCGDLWQLVATAAVEPEVRSRFDAIDRDLQEALYYLGTAVASAEKIILSLRELAEADAPRDPHGAGY